MKEIPRPKYLQSLINKKENGLVKIVTGIRRCGKSYLLDPIFKDYLLGQGVNEDHIIKIDLDEIENQIYHDPNELNKYVKSLIKDNNMYYVILDEVQKVREFEAVLNGFLHVKNLDVYVTGSNSKFLSSDIITEFRGRGDEIRVLPLTFNEYCSAFSGTTEEAWNEYVVYGGLPRILYCKTEEEKSKYLIDLFKEAYLKDIIDRYNIQRTDVLDALVNIIASSVGSLTNPKKLSDTFESNGVKGASINTITSYLDYLEDAFLIRKAQRYDVKGKRYISTPYKYYFSDIGLRNARINFRQQEEAHLMENIIFNELCYRGYNVDVGVVEIRDNNTNKTQVEVDFVCNQSFKRYYVQSALELQTREKTIQEERPLLNINDNFKKIIITKNTQKHWLTEEGILIIGIQEFLFNESSLDI